MKILAPAGNFDSLKAAVYNGADEVYLGINDFNARNNIDGFNLDNLQEAVDFAHIFGVKVHLAINILFTDDELQSAVNTVINAFNMGVDAFIVQDLGLCSLLHTNYPEIELHASTQMGLHNLEGVKAVEKFGFKRIVLARETPLSEIKRIKENSNVEIEYFAQGALCVSFSGNCYLSSYLFDKSGNRGRCKQLCRLPFTFEYKGKKLKSGYLLSAKDFNMLERLKDLEKAGVNAIKIEGRARRPFYVATATREYYKALNGIAPSVENLQLAFNRNFTAGYFDGNGKIISSIQNHIGIEVGKVDKINYGKKFNEVFITSNRPLSPKSTFKTFYNGIERTTFSAYDLVKIKDGYYKLTTTNKLNVNESVNLIVDNKVEQDLLSQTKKKNIEIFIKAETNKPIVAEFNFNGKNLSVLGDTCIVANNHPLTIEEIKLNFSKSEFFDANVNVVTLDQIFMPKQKLNEFRRNVFMAVKESLTLPYRKNINPILVKPCEYKKFNDFQIVYDLNTPLKSQNIIYSPEIYSIDDVLAFKEQCLTNGKTPYLDTPNFALDKDVALLKDIIAKTKINIVANNYYAIGLTKNTVIGAGLNVYNSTSANVFNLPVITAESNIAEKINFPYMTLRHCPMKSHLNSSCSNCKYEDGYTYKMDSGKILRLKRKKLTDCTFYLI